MSTRGPTSATTSTKTRPIASCRSSRNISRRSDTMVAAQQLVPEVTPNANANVVELVRVFASSQPSTRALVDIKSKRTLTFAELAREVADVALALQLAGLKP